MVKTKAEYALWALAANLTLISGCASAMDADDEMKAADIIKQLNREQQEALLVDAHTGRENRPETPIAQARPRDSGRGDGQR